ncbi:membrane-anchored junction protein isoform X2 [Pungitius pungitius]|uniref:membrane-anchored junction protein isoform X2 n=1 Tax=Pungitius pungitius TaxID=134920 RepID=UPI002E128BDA
MRSVMPLQAVSFPLPETRFFKADSLIYKFKISGGRSLRGEEAVGENLHEELEEIIRAVLGNLDSLQPFSSAHFNVFPYKKPWEGASKVTCTHGERRLRAYPFSLVLYLEKNPQNEGAKQAAENLRPKDVAKPFHRVSEPPSKRRRRDSPLEEAILKELHEDMEAQGKVSVLGRPSLHCPHAQKQVGEDPGHVDKKASTAFDERRQKAGVNTVRGRRTADEVPCGSMRHMGEEEEELDQELGSVAETPARPGMLSRLVRGIFPFSLLFRKP